MPAARESIEALALQTDNLIGVATGNLSRAGWSKLDRGGLRHWVKFGGFAEDGVLRADILRAAQKRSLEIAGPGNHDFWVIGDTPKDIDAARAIGARVLAVATGKYELEELAAYKPDLLYADLRELMANLSVLD